jgi:hypothetical protein
MTFGKRAIAVFMAGSLMGVSPPAWAAMPPDSRVTHQESRLLDQLASAEHLDWQYALDPSIAPVRRDDFLDQMNQVARLIKFITHGLEVPQRELADALWIPPKAMPRKTRERMIQELQQAKLQDDRNEQEAFSYSEWSTSDGGAAPIDTAAFDQQMQLVDSVITDLEIGEEVHWSEIKEALYVPPASYPEQDSSRSEQLVTWPFEGLPALPLVATRRDG